MTLLHLTLSRWTYSQPVLHKNVEFLLQSHSLTRPCQSLTYNMYVPGATAESNANGSQSAGQSQTATGSVGSYQSSRGSPESHSALSPSPHSPATHSPPQQNGMGSPGPLHSSVILQDLSQTDYRLGFKQVSVEEWGDLWLMLLSCDASR